MSADLSVPGDPFADRIVPPTPWHPGMTQIMRHGRCFQMAGIGPDVEARLDQFAYQSTKDEA